MILSDEKLKEKNYKNPLYTVYLGMKKRCYTPSTIGFENYGGKGIKVCENWKADFLNFYKWAISNGYYYNTEETRGQKLSIDRIDSNGDYSPSNCRWIRHSENSRRANIGKHRKDITKQKISEALKGRKFSEERKQKLSLCSKGKGKNNLNAKKGIYKMYDKKGNLIKVFSRPKDIEEYFKPRKIALGTINATAHKVGYRKTAYGFIWGYENESE